MKNQFIKTIAREIVFPISVKFGLHKLIIKQTNGVLNIYFHGVTPKDFTNVSGRHMPLAQFENLLKYLKNNFQIIDMNSAFNMQKPSRAKEKFLSISFDDGYLNNYKYLPSILKKYNIPITIFVCGVAFEQTDYVMWTDQIALMRHFHQGDFIEIDNEKFYKRGKYELINDKGISLYSLIKEMGPGTRALYLERLNVKYNTIELTRTYDEDYWKLMNARQIQELQNTGLFHFASHGMYHYNLANISPMEAHNDMLESSRLLQEITGKKVDSISFPDGSYNAEVITEAKSTGFNQLWISSYNNKLDVSHPSLRARFGVSSTTNHYSNIISIHKAFNSHGI